MPLNTTVLRLHHGLIIPTVCPFFKGGNKGKIGLMCYALRNQAVLGPLHSAPLLRFRQKRQPGVGPETWPLPGEPPCREPQRIHIYKRRGGTRRTINSCTPLPLLFCPPFWGRKDLTHFPAPPLHLDNKTHHYDLLSDIEAINRDCRFYNPALTCEDYGHLAEPGGQNSNAEITAKGGRLNDEQVS